MDFTGKRFQIDRDSEGTELLIRLYGLWHLQLYFCWPPKTWCLAWKTRALACDILVMIGLWIVMFSIYKYYPSGGNKYPRKFNPERQAGCQN